MVVEKLTKRICITMPDNIFQKLENYVNFWPLEEGNRSRHISNLIDECTPILDPEMD